VVAAQPILEEALVFRDDGPEAHVELRHLA
jgi:hypothetical protein